MYWFIILGYYQLTASHSRGVAPPFGAPPGASPWTRLPLPLGCQKEREVLFEGKSLTLVVLCTSTALRRLALCVRLLLDKEKFIGYATRF